MGNVNGGITTPECFRIYKCKQSQKANNPMFGSIAMSNVIFGAEEANRKKIELEGTLSLREVKEGWYYMTHKASCPKPPRRGARKPSSSKVQPKTRA